MKKICKYFHLTNKFTKIFTNIRAPFPSAGNTMRNVYFNYIYSDYLLILLQFIDLIVRPFIFISKIGKYRLHVKQYRQQFQTDGKDDCTDTVLEGRAEWVGGWGGGQSVP